jgi:hypothetical protein
MVACLRAIRKEIVSSWINNGIKVHYERWHAKQTSTSPTITVDEELALSSYMARSTSIHIEYQNTLERKATLKY